MNVRAIKTDIVPPGQSLVDVLNKHLTELPEKSILAITSKVVALCENRVVPIGSINKQELVEQESDYFLDLSLSKYSLSFSIVRGTLIPMAGIDESNGNGNYVLWPKDPQQSAEEVRQYLKKRFSLKHAGVIITDSTARPLHYGTEGVGIGYSGFAPSNSYIGKPDLFGRDLRVSISNMLDALAASAVAVMGEGSEATPLATINDLPFVQFQDREPNAKELEGFYLKHMEDDLFGPFLKNAPWQKGSRDNKNPA